MSVQPLPINDPSSSKWAAPWRRAMQPHIYSPSDSHSSLNSAMYPCPYSGSPSSSPRDTYFADDRYYSKDSALSAPRFNSWSTYSFSRSLSHPHAETAVNPKVTILPSQLPAMPDVDTPSSASSHSVLTPLSPFAHYNVGESDVQDMEFDDFEYDDDDDDEDEYVDSDSAEEMEVVDEVYQAQSPLYAASAPHAIKSTSSLEGALGEAPSTSYATHLEGCLHPFPVHPSPPPRRAYYHPPAAERTLSSSSAFSSRSIPTHVYPAQLLIFNNIVRTDVIIILVQPVINFIFIIAYGRIYFRSIITFVTINPIRPIPPIPLAELTSRATEGSASDPCGESHSSGRLRALSPLPLLCQPVSDAVRYQLKQSPSNGALGYGETCEDGATEIDQFAHERYASSQEHQSAVGTSSMEQMCPWVWR
ncbi:hypothetical protein BU15DRAFT_58708 [Melanogaster broomeanus]|nr:hypothetical protein BU15DRAFT_58708 [Melanogaster broomeanus]